LDEEMDPFFDQIAFVIRTGANVIEKRMGGQVLTWVGRVKKVVWVSDHSVEEPYEFDWHGIRLRHPRVYNGVSGRWALAEDPFNQPDSPAWDKDFVKHYAALAHVWESFRDDPTVRYFMMADDDTYVLLQRVKALIQRNEEDREVDPLVSKTIAAVCYGLDDVEQAKACGRYPHTEDGAYYPAGGGGVLMTRAALEAVAAIIDDCTRKYATCWAGDRRLGACLFDAGVTCDRGAHWDTRDIAQDLHLAEHPPSYLATIHKLPPHMMIFLDYWTQLAVDPPGHASVDTFVRFWPMLQDYEIWGNLPMKGDIGGIGKG
jgi:hypothetical protein